MVKIFPVPPPQGICKGKPKAQIIHLYNKSAGQNYEEALRKNALSEKAYFQKYYRSVGTFLLLLRSRFNEGANKEVVESQKKYWEQLDGDEWHPHLLDLVSMPWKPDGYN